MKITNVLSGLLSLLPTTNLMTFNSFPDYTDNAYAVFVYIAKYGKNDYSLVWLINDKESIKKVQKSIDDLGIKARAVYKFSLVGLWYFLRCRYCFYTHGILETIHLRQHKDKMVNLWHGMPLKRIGIADGKGTEYMHNTNVLVANSTSFQKIMAECFGVKESSVLPIGQPRCDMLFEKTDFFHKNGIRKSSYTKVGIWLPTYRKSEISDIRTDGEFTPEKIAFLDVDMMKCLDQVLKKLNQLLLIKLHPMDKLQESQFPTFDRIMIIKQKDFNFQLYPLLGACDYLLTDFSSVCVDYDILRRPMGFPICDLAEYKQNRGFMFDDVIKVLPGTPIFDYEQLVSFIERPQYKSSPITLNDYYDNKATERLIQFLNI